MSKAAGSIVYFGVYILLTGLVLLIAPNILLTTFGLGSTNEVWIRVLGCVVAALGWIFVSFLSLVLMGLAKPPLVLFGAVDLLGALWTWRALRTDA